MARVARLVSALRIFSKKLKEYYEAKVEEPSADGYPYYRQFNNQKFEYDSQIAKNRVFIAKLGTQQILVKFSRKYSAEAHQACNLAPKFMHTEHVNHLAFNSNCL